MIVGSAGRRGKTAAGEAWVALGCGETEDGEECLAEGSTARGNGGGAKWGTRPVEPKGH